MNLLTSNGYSPLAIAAKYQNFTAMEYLLRLSGSPPSFTENPRLECYLYSLPVLSLLLEYGAKLKRGTLVIKKSYLKK